MLMLAFSAGAGLAAQSLPWVWTLYENKASVSLAHEVPDTSKLDAVLECSPGSGRIKVTLYPGGAGGGDRLTAQLAASDPVFQTFLSSGRLSLKSATGASVAMPAPDTAKLASFAKLCGP